MKSFLYSRNLRNKVNGLSVEAALVGVNVGRNDHPTIIIFMETTLAQSKKSF